jgi:hypothetical protein
MFRALFAWLNKRFPEQLTVTKQEYKELREEVAQLNLYVQGIQELNKEILLIKAQLGRLNDANGFQNNVKGSFKLER